MSNSKSLDFVTAVRDLKSVAPLWPAIRRDVETLGRDVSKLTELVLAAGQGRVATEAKQMTSGIAALSRRLNAQTKSRALSLRGFAVSRPVLSVAVAFGAGMLVAFMAKNRR